MLFTIITVLAVILYYLYYDIQNNIISSVRLSYHSLMVIAECISVRQVIIFDDSHHLSSNPTDSSPKADKHKDQVVQSGYSDQSVRIMSLNNKKAWAYRNCVLLRPLCVCVRVCVVCVSVCVCVHVCVCLCIWM